MQHDTIAFPVLGDTGVHEIGEGYERTMILSGWDPESPNTMMQAKIRIDRVPGNSYAKASIWDSHTGWTEVFTLHSVIFWTFMPGYTRWKQDRTETKTMQLAINLASRLREDIDTLRKAIQ